MQMLRIWIWVFFLHLWISWSWIFLVDVDGIHSNYRYFIIYLIFSHPYKDILTVACAFLYCHMYKNAMYIFMHFIIQAWGTQLVRFWIIVNCREIISHHHVKTRRYLAQRSKFQANFLFCSWCIHDSWKCYLYVVVVTDTSYGEKRAIIHKYCPLFHLSLTCVCILNYTVTWLFTFLYSVDFMILVIYGCRMKDRMISSAFESRWEMGAQFYNMHESIEICCNPFFYTLLIPKAVPVLQSCGRHIVLVHRL